MSCCTSGNQYKEYEQVGIEYDKERKYDKKFKGPLSKRSCTDVLCCISFLVFVLALIAVSFWAYVHGDFNKLIHPTNSKGELCGFSRLSRNTSQLVFFDLVECLSMGPALISLGCPTKQICVSKCPTTFWSLAINTGRENMVCDGDKNGSDNQYKLKSIEDLVNNRICARYVFPSLSVTNRCIPDLTKLVQFLNKNNSNNNRDEINKILNVIKQNESYFSIVGVLTRLVFDFFIWYKYISVFFGLALIASLIYLLVLRFFAAFMVWFTIISFVLVFIAGSVICFFTYYLIQKQIFEEKYYSWYILSKNLSDKFWLAMGIIMSVILVLLILMLIFLRNKIRITIAILTCTSKALIYMMGLFIWPVVLFIMQMVVVSGCILLVMQLSSIRSVEGVGADINSLSNLNTSGTREKLKEMLDQIPCTPGENATSQKLCTFLRYGSKTYIYIIMIYVLFMFFWLINFIKALGQITIAGAFASYYFAFTKPKDIPTYPVVLSFWRAIRFHMGSLAFGSLLLAIVQVIRALLEFIQQRAKFSHNLIAIFVVKCLKCCFWCLEKFIKCINKNAYIMIAIYGQSYCSAAMNAFQLLSRNVIRVFVVDKVTEFVIFMAKLVIVGIFGILSFVVFNGTISDLIPKLFYYYVPVIITIIGTYIISTMIFQIYSLGVDTIFLCFCEDLERNDGSVDKPYFMTKQLKSVLMKYNRKSFELSKRESAAVTG